MGFRGSFYINIETFQHSFAMLRMFELMPFHFAYDVPALSEAP